jgi:acyl-homoserine-lactone acylase
MAKREGKWISLRSNNRSMSSLEQSWIRTKSKSFEDYKKAMDLRANTSNNTVYADTNGNIAYWHGNFIPVRDPFFNWGKAVDGTTKKTEWKGLHPVSETVHIYNPPNGWLQNCNSTPFSAAGTNSPKKDNYPAYMAPDGENYRGLNAVRLFNTDKKYTLDQLITTGYDSRLSIFEVLLPALFANFEKQSNQNELIYSELKEPISLLKNWDYYANENSIATTLANEWAYKLDPILQKVYIDEGEKDQIENTEEFAKKATPDQMLPQLLEVVNELKTKFGSWKIPWGDLNRYQRITGAINLDFDDAAPSLPIGRASGLWGSLPAYKSAYQNNSKKRYGFNGNSFVCVVEFGAKIKAKSVLTGGNSGDPKSKHFNDQATMYQKGQFKDVHFYEEDVIKNAEKTYHPGE